MSLNNNRTLYPNFENQVFHIYPDAGAPSGLREKYGRNVFRWGAGVGLGNAIAIANPGDTILIWPGDYTLTSTISVNRPNITIRSATGNKHSVNLDISATDDVIAITIGSDGDNVTIADLTVTGDDSATPAVGISSAGTGTILENLVLLGGDVGDTVAGILCTAGQATVRNCETFDYIYGIQITGAARSRVEGNYIHTDNVDCRGIDVAGVSSWSLIRENVIHGGATTGTEGIVVANGSLLVTLGRNKIWSDADTDFTGGSGGTEWYENVLMGETTAAWIK